MKKIILLKILLIIKKEKNIINDDVKSLKKEYKFPSTPSEIFIHIKTIQQDDLLFKLVDWFFLRLEKIKINKENIKVRNTFTELDGRNQFGFFDAGSDAEKTQNPIMEVGPRVKTEDGKIWDLGRFATCIIGNEDKKHRNGSYVIVSDWLHFRLNEFLNMSNLDQSKVFGRDKITGNLYGLIGSSDPLGGLLNHELPNGHIIRTHIRTGPTSKNPSKIPLQIYRQAGSWRDGNDRGLFFVAYCRYVQTFERMLEQMIGETTTIPEQVIGKDSYGKPTYRPDHLLDFSDMISGAYFYIPSLWCLYNWQDNPDEEHSKKVSYFNRIKKEKE